jgi:hypothetical protein
MKGTPDYSDYEKRGMLAKEMFYHDGRIPSLTVSQKGISKIMRIFLKHLLIDYPRHIFAGKKTKRKFFRALYRFMFKELFSATVDDIRDYMKILNFTGESPSAIQNAISNKYLSPERIDALAGKARANKQSPQSIYKG